MDTNDLHERSFTRDLRSRNRSPRTIDNYMDAIKALRRHTGDTDLAALTTDDLRGFFDAQLAALSPTTAAIRYRALQQFYKWMAVEEIVPASPMATLRPPFVPETPVPTISLAQIGALLKDCDGKGFEARRDSAILRLFLEPGGMRLSELVGLSLDDVDFQLDEVIVMGKGRRPRSVPFGAKTGMALERYVRERSTHKWHRLPGLWLGGKGPMTNSGVQQMLRRRAARAGIPHLHPHMLRHTAAHEWMASGGQETDAMRLFGWRSRAMLGRYGASAADERAKEASRRMSLGDRY